MDIPNDKPRRLLSIGTDHLLFVDGSAVRARIAGYAKDWDEIHIIVSTDRTFVESSIAPNVWIYPTKSKRKALYPLDAIRLGRFIIERRGITEITCQDPFLTAIAGVSLKKQFGLPLELQVHTDIGSPNFTYTIANRVRKALALSYLKRADTIRVVSNRIKDYIAGTISVDPSRITVRPIAVDIERIKNASITADLGEKYPQFDKIALVASRLEPEKRVDLVVSSWPEVLRVIPKAGLVIVGKGSEEQKLRELAKKLGLSGSVIFLPWADQPTLTSYYKTADVFVNTSMFEGYGMTLVEAHAAGLKIVSTDVGVAREVGAAIVDWRPSHVARGIAAVLGV